MLADELSHRPRFTHRRAMRAQLRKVANQSLDQILFTVPEISEQLALFLGGEEVGRKRRQRGVDSLRRGASRPQVTFLPLNVGWHPSLPKYRVINAHRRRKVCRRLLGRTDDCHQKGRLAGDHEYRPLHTKRLNRKEPKFALNSRQEPLPTNRKVGARLGT